MQISVFFLLLHSQDVFEVIIHLLSLHARQVYIECLILSYSRCTILILYQIDDDGAQPNDDNNRRFI